jgi:hypothetical protein
VNGEYISAGIRKQIAEMERLLRDLQKKPVPSRDFAGRLSAIEARLRRLREQILELGANPRGGINPWFN